MQVHLASQVHLVSLAPKVHLAPQAPQEQVEWDTQDHRGHPDHPDLLVILHLESLETQVLLENQVLMGCQEIEEFPELQDHKEQEEHQDLLAAQVLPASLLLESQDHMDYQVQWGPEESPDRKDSQVFLAHTALKENQVTVSQEVLVALVQWVLWASPVSLVNQESESPVQLDSLGSLENQVCQVEMGLQVPWVNLA